MAVQLLSTLKAGEKGTIIRVEGRGNLRHRMVDMGVVAGTPVEVVRLAPLGDPMEVRLRGYRLSLRKREASGVRVEVGG